MAFGSARLTASIVAAALIGVAATEISADLEARSAVRRIVAAHPGLKIRSTHADPFSGTLVLEGIEAGGDSARHVEIGRLTLTRPSTGFGLIASARADSWIESGPKPPGQTPAPRPGAATDAGTKPAPPNPAPAAPITGTASAENVVITTPKVTYRIDRIDMTGTRLSNADLARLLDPNSGESVESRLRQVSATSIVIPVFNADDPTGGRNGHVSFYRVTLSGVVAGKATALHVSNGIFLSHDGDATTSGGMGAIEAFGVDFAQAAHVVGTVRRNDAEPILPIADSVTVNAIGASDERGSSLTIAALKETGLKARPLETDVLVAGGTGRKLSKAEEAALFRDMSHSFEIGSLELSDVAAKGKDPNDPLTFNLASVSMRGLGKGKVGGFGARGLRLETPTVKLGLARADVGSFDLPNGNLNAIGPATTMAAQIVGKADFDGIDVDVTTKDAVKGDQRVAFKIGHASVASTGAPGDIPTTSKIAIDNVAFDMPADPGQAKPLAEMGYRHLDLSAGLSSRFDAAGQELFIRPLSLKGVDMGTLEIGLHLLNVTKGVISPKPEIQRASVAAMLVKEVSVDIVNEGLVDRIIAWKAKQDHMSVDAEKASVVEFFSKSLPSQFTSANVKVLGDAIAKFVASPKTLHIDILSKGGLGAGSMALLNDPNLLMDMLDVHASAD